MIALFEFMQGFSKAQFAARLQQTSLQFVILVFRCRVSYQVGLDFILKDNFSTCWGEMNTFDCQHSLQLVSVLYNRR